MYILPLLPFLKWSTQSNHVTTSHCYVFSYVILQTGCRLVILPVPVKAPHKVNYYFFVSFFSPHTSHTPNNKLHSSGSMILRLTYKVTKSVFVDLPKHVHHLGEIKLQRLQCYIHLGFQLTVTERQLYISDKQTLILIESCCICLIKYLGFNQAYWDFMFFILHDKHFISGIDQGKSKSIYHFWKNNNVQSANIFNQTSL